MSIPELLRTKLLIPPVRRELVERRRLFSLLDESLSVGLALISAPAGYGKTTLVSDWARRLDIPVAWISLDEGDNDPARFLGHFCASFEAVDPSLAESLLELARADRLGGLGTAMAQEALRTGLLNHLQSVPNPFVLVLDDFHLISSQPVQRLVGFLVDHLPPRMHLVIASRADPSLPLARLRARGDLVEIRQSHLRFTSEETTAFLNRELGQGLEPGDVMALASRTEGWIAGLRLAASSMQSRADVHQFIQDFKGSNRYILDYLLEEVLQRQPGEIRDFLLQSSILDRLAGPLCDAVTEQRGGQAMLEKLEQSNLFILPLDDERKWYRYHRLFADLLRKQLGESHPEMVRDLHRRAGVWYERNGLPAEAIHHLLAAEEFERAAQLIEQVAETTLMRGESATLRRWLGALPGQQLRARPHLSAYYAWVLLAGGASLEAVEARLTDVEGYPTPLTLPLRAWASLYRGNLAAAIEESRRALEQLPENLPFLRGLATMSLAGAYHVNGDIATSERILRDAALTPHPDGNLMTSVYAVQYQAERCRREGDLGKARSLYQQALDLATDEKGERLPIASQVLAGLGEIARERNELGAATHYVLEGIELAERWAQAGGLDSYMTLARIRRAQGDWGGAHEAIKAMRRVAVAFKATDLTDRAVELAEAWLQVVEFDPSTHSTSALDGPRQWASRYGLDENVDPQALENKDGAMERRFRKYEYPVLARLRLAEGRPAAAHALLESALPIAEKNKRVGLVIEYRILMALAEQALGRNGRAMQSLEQALALAEKGRFVRVFVDEGRPMARLLHEAVSQAILPHYSRQLLAAFSTSYQPLAPDRQPSTASTSDPGIGATNAVVEHLSERELDVLRLVAEGLSNEEIARRLVVSLPTIKFHTSNIYGKLNVRNRTEAVARARGIGLLPLA